MDPDASTGTIAAADGALDAARRAPKVEDGVEATSLGSTSSISISSARVAMEPGKRSLAFIVLECWPIKKAPNLFKAK